MVEQTKLVYLREVLGKLLLNNVKVWLIVLIYGTIGFSFTHAQSPVQVVVLDPGHGGKDRGCMGPTGVKEKNMNLKLALAVGKKIKEQFPDVKVYYTRTSDHFVELYERGEIANRHKADLFISIHCNANPSRVPYGTETFVMGLHKSDDNLEVAKRENGSILQEEGYKKNYKGFDPSSPLAYIMLTNYQNAFLASSLSFATKVEREFKRYADRLSRGVKQAGFIVLWKTTMPSVLVEVGFLSNRKEEKFLDSEEGQDKISESIVRAFAKYKEEMDSQ